MKIMRMGLTTALLSAFCLSTSPSAAESLKDAMTLAFDTNPTIRAQRAEQRANSEATAQAWAGALPQISANGSYSDLQDKQTVNGAVIGGAGAAQQTFNLNPINAAVTAEQPIFTGFRNYNAIRQAKARVKAGGAQLIGVEQQVLLDTASAYFNLLRDTTVYEANLNNVKVLLRQKDEADLRFKVGEITKTDVAQADARLAGARAQLSGAQAQLAVSRANYLNLVGSPAGDLDAETAIPQLPDSEENAQALAQVYAPAVIAAKEQEKASSRQIAIEKGAFAPSVSLTASYQYAEEPSSFVLKDEQFAYGVRASIPIFLGGLRLSRTRQARALNDSDRMRVIEAERLSRARVTGSWEQMIAAKSTIVSATRQVEANDLALTGVRREAQLGARSTLDVLNAEQEFLNATVSLANAKRDEQVAAYTLLASMGVLTLDAAGQTAQAQN